MSANIKSVVQTFLKIPTKCRHCEATAELEYFSEDDPMIGVHVCPERYVTRIIAYGENIDPTKFEKFIESVVDGLGHVEDADIRMAKRYAWDLGIARKTNDLILMEGYWTQNYRRTKNEDSKRSALFLCTNGDSFFVQSLTSKGKFCEKCR